MKGSIRRKGKAWSYRVYVSTVDGQNKQIEKGGFKTKKDAELALTKFVNDYEETGIYPENKKITFNEVYEEFIELEGKFSILFSFKTTFLNLLVMTVNCTHIHPI